MKTSELWKKVGHLFDTDDGSLPDIFVENLSDEEMLSIYNFVMLHAQLNGKATAWNIEEEKDVPLREIENPAKLFIENRIESFRHLIDLRYEGIQLPSLSISIAQETIEFDYRMGGEWNEKNTSVLFHFLLNIQALAPKSRKQTKEATKIQMKYFKSPYMSSSKNRHIQPELSTPFARPSLTAS